MSTIYFILRWAALVALLLAVNALYGCGHAPSGLRFTYHDATELQTMELDCVLELVSETGVTGAGDVQFVSYIQEDPLHPGEVVYGRTTGRDDYLRVALLSQVFMPQIFVHELMHVLAGQEAGDRDADHNDPRYFGPGSLTELYAYQAYSLCQR